MFMDMGVKPQILGTSKKYLNYSTQFIQKLLNSKPVIHLSIDKTNKQHKFDENEKTLKKNQGAKSNP